GFRRRRERRARDPERTRRRPTQGRSDQYGRAAANHLFRWSCRRAPDQERCPRRPQGSTWKLNIMPLSWCSAMWQCAIQMPGFVTCSRMSTVSPVRISTVSFQTRFCSGWPSLAKIKNRPAPWMWNGWCIGWSESISLTSRILTRSPTRKRQLMAWFSASSDRSISFQRVLAGVVSRLTSTISSSLDPANLVLMLAMVVLVSDLAVMRLVLVMRRLIAMLVVAMRMRVALSARDEARRYQLHSALRTAVWLFARHLRVHRAGIASRRGHGQELHAAFRALSLFIADHLGMHGTGVDQLLAGGEARGFHIHLSDERERLVRLGLDFGVQPSALLGELGV